MKSFAHKKLLNNFFEVLRSPVHPEGIQKMTARSGGTTRQDAMVSVIAGELTLESLPEFATSLNRVLSGTVKLIVLDLSGVTVLCPNAVSVLVNFVSFVEGGGKRLILFRPSQTVQTVLASLHLTHLFETQHSEEELLLALPD